MTLCSSGSSPKSTAPPYAWITWLDAKSWLGSHWGIFAWLAGLIQPVLQDVTVFCATEPTQPVYPGDATVTAAMTNPAAFDALVVYLKDSAVWWAWSQLCQCDASGSPGCEPAMVSHTVNGTSFETSQSFPCGGTMTPHINGLSCFGAWFDSYAAQTIQLLCFRSGEVFRSQDFVCAPGWNALYYSTPVTLIQGHQYWVIVRNANNSLPYNCYRTLSFTPSFGTSDITWNGNVFMSGDLSTSTPDTNYREVDPMVCVGPPGPTDAPPPPAPTTSLPDLPTATCTTVGDLCGLVNPMVDQFALLKARLDLLQRRSLPFAWIAGSPLTGLTGAGSFTVQDCLGVIVDITTVPASWGSTTATPRRLQPAAGLIQGQLGSEWDDGRWVHYEHQVVLWDNPWATGVRYNFKPGIVATVTPLYPEP